MQSDAFGKSNWDRTYTVNADKQKDLSVQVHSFLKIATWLMNIARYLHGSELGYNSLNIMLELYKSLVRLHLKTST